MDYSITTFDSTWSIRLDGSFSFTDNQKFREIVSKIKAAKIASADLDISGISFIDSAALGMLLLLREEAEKSRTVITLSRPAGQVRKMLELSRFSQLFTIKD